MHNDLLKFRKSVFYTISFVGLLWLIRLTESSFAFDFGVFGIHPRSIAGSVGIITGPLVHGDFHHLLSNSLPLLFLGIGVFYFYHRVALEVFVWIYLFTGFWVWVMARDAYHIGASGIVYGLASFLLFSGFFRKDSRSIAISLVVIFLYGGMVYGLSPVNDEISYESHILGTIGGFVTAFFYRKTPLSPPRTYAELPEREDMMYDGWQAFEDDSGKNTEKPSINQNHTYHRHNYHFRYTYRRKPKTPEDSDNEN